MSNQKKWILLSSAGVLITAISLFLLTRPSDDIIPGFVKEPVIPFADNNLNLEIQTSQLFNELDVKDMVFLPDGTIISVGQVFTDRNLFAPALVRSNVNGGVIWTTFLNPVVLDGIEYVADGTFDNAISKIFYVNENLIYIVGSVRASVYDVDGNPRRISGNFNHTQDFPLSNDLLVYIASFSSTLSNFTFHGFIAPPELNGNQGTVVADATLIDETTMVLTGVSNRRAGLLENAVAKSPFDFVLRLEMTDTLTFQNLFTFNHDTFVQPSKVTALANGDLIVSGNFSEATGDFANIPLSSAVQSAGFVARIDGASFTLEWISSNLMQNQTTPAITQFLNVMELANHQLVTIANVSTNQVSAVMVTALSRTGKIQTQRILDVGQRQWQATQLYKAATGYWITGLIKDQLQDNVVLVKMTPFLRTDFVYEIQGSGQESWLAKPLLNVEGQWLLPIGTTSQDLEYGSLANLENIYRQIWLILS